MRSVVALVALSAAIAAAACTDGPLAPPMGYPFARAVRSCGPADGPAVGIVLADHEVSATTEPPFIGVNIWTSAEDAVGKTINVGPGSADGFAYYASINRSKAVDVYGTITVSGLVVEESFPTQHIIEGTVDLTMAGHPRIRGGFRTTLQPPTFLCG